ncbi:DNA helicase MCM9-like isoform X2 [Artemia franciscana]
MKLLDNYQLLCENILCQPVQCLPIAKMALIEAQKSLVQGINDEQKSKAFVKTNCRIEVIGLPECPELYRVTIPHTRDVGLFICLSGTVIRTTQPKMLEYRRNYQCVKCQYTFTLEADFEQHYVFQPPSKCEGPNSCNSTSFVSHGKTNPDSYKDYQEVKLQEHVQKLSLGSIPRSIWVTLEDDLVDACKPGDDIRVCGIVLQRWKPLYRGQRSDIELVIKSNHIQVNNDQRAAALVTEDLKREFSQFWSRHRGEPLTGRDQILAAFCPQIYGLYAVKLAVALILCGGVQRIDVNGSRVRGEPHLLLVGDPGCGKSQFLKYAAKLCPRSVLTTGIGSTSAGLTVAAAKDSGEWQLEAGALVLADGGVCCIDEFSSIKEADRAAIHEAMEQQTISVAKAGLVCKLDTRCSVLAATNPRGCFDPSQSLSINVAMATPLLSRFDLVLVLLDRKDNEWDRLISSYILEGKDPTKFIEKPDNSPLWSMEKLQAYICYVRQLKPEMSEAANEILVKYYQFQRKAELRSTGRTTVRMLESLVRLCQAHARLMMRSEVTVCDALIVVSLFEISMEGTSLLDGKCPLQSPFPEDPMAEYWRAAHSILIKLNLSETWETEKRRLIEEYQISPAVVEENLNDAKSKETHKALEKTEKILQNIHQRRAVEQTQVCETKKRKNIFERGKKKRKIIQAENSSEDEGLLVFEESFEAYFKENAMEKDENDEKGKNVSDDEDFVSQPSFLSRFRKVFNLPKKPKIATRSLKESKPTHFETKSPEKLSESLIHISTEKTSEFTEENKLDDAENRFQSIAGSSIRTGNNINDSVKSTDGESDSSHKKPLPEKVFPSPRDYINVVTDLSLIDESSLNIIKNTRNKSTEDSLSKEKKGISKLKRFVRSDDDSDDCDSASSSPLLEDVRHSTDYPNKSESIYPVVNKAASDISVKPKSPVCGKTNEIADNKKGESVMNQNPDLKEKITICHQGKSKLIPGPAGSPLVRRGPPPLASKLSFISKLRSRNSNDSQLMSVSNISCNRSVLVRDQRPQLQTVHTAAILSKKLSTEKSVDVGDTARNSVEFQPDKAHSTSGTKSTVNHTSFYVSGKDMTGNSTLTNSTNINPYRPSSSTILESAPKVPVSVTNHSDASPSKDNQKSSAASRSSHSNQSILKRSFKFPKNIRPSSNDPPPPLTSSIGVFDHSLSRSVYNECKSSDDRDIPEDSSVDTTNFGMKGSNSPTLYLGATRDTCETRNFSSTASSVKTDGRESEPFLVSFLKRNMTNNLEPNNSNQESLVPVDSAVSKLKPLFQFKKRFLRDKPNSGGDISLVRQIESYKSSSFSSTVKEETNNTNSSDLSEYANLLPKNSQPLDSDSDFESFLNDLDF